jgi:WD40 repeat protein
MRCLSALAHNQEAEGDLEAAAETHEEAGSAEDAARVRVQIAAESASKPVCPKCGSPVADAKELRWCGACRAFVGTRRPRWTQSFEFSAGDSVRCVAVAGDGSMLALGSADRTVYAIDSRGGLIWKHATGDRVGRVAISGLRNAVVAGSADRNLYIFDGSGALQARVPVPTPVCAVATTADGYLVASGSEKDLLVFDRQGRRLWEQKFPGFVTDVSMAVGGSLVAAACSDGTLAAFDRTGAQAFRLSLGSLADASSSGDASVIACVSDEGALHVVDQRGSPVFRDRVDDPIRPDAQHFVKVSHDGSLVAVAAGCLVAAFDRSGRKLFRYSASSRVTGLAVSGDGRFVAAAATPKTVVEGAEGRRGQVLVFDRGGRLAWRDEAGGSPFRVSLSQDGSLLACGSEDPKLRVFRLVAEQDALAAANEALARAIAMLARGERAAAAAAFEELGLAEEAAMARATPPADAKAEPQPAPRIQEASPQVPATTPPTDSPGAAPAPSPAPSPAPAPRATGPASPPAEGATPGRQAAFERYRRAVRRAIEDDRIIDQKERGFLDDLREAWGIDQLTAARIEEEERRAFQLHPPQIERVAKPATPMKACGNCGTSNDPAAKACAKCGLLLG